MIFLTEHAPAAKSLSTTCAGVFDVPPTKPSLCHLPLLAGGGSTGSTTAVQQGCAITNSVSRMTAQQPSGLCKPVPLTPMSGQEAALLQEWWTMCGQCDLTAAWLALASDCKAKLQLGHTLVRFEPECENSGNDAIPTEDQHRPDSPNRQVTSERAVFEFPKRDPKWEN
jgi:hypothetical protein